MPESTPNATPESPSQVAAERPPIGLIGPEWALRKSVRGAALWRHAGVLSASGQEHVEVLAIDREANGPRFQFRDEWNIPTAGVQFRVRRVNGGERAAPFDEMACARLEGAVLGWVRDRAPRIVHVLGLDSFGPGVLLALDAAEVPTVLTLERVQEVQAEMEAAEVRSSGARNLYAAALSSVRRIIVRSTSEAAVAEATGAPREKIRVMKAGDEGEMPILRAYASLYRLLAPVVEPTIADVTVADVQAPEAAHPDAEGSDASAPSARVSA